MKPFGTRQRIPSLTATVAVLSLLTGAAACDSPLGGDDDGEIGIRIVNESAVDFDRVTVGFPQETVEYGALAAGDSSAYHLVGRAYRYAYVEVEVDGVEHRIQPIDYVGETPLGRGRYTYALDYGSTFGLGLDFRIDRISGHY